MQKKQKIPSAACTIGQVAAQTGLKVPTIRFYEQIGLLKPPRRSSGNRREYDSDALERLRFIRHARELGFEIADIRELLELASHPSQSCDKADAIAQRHLQHVEKRIAQLQALRHELSRMLDCHAHNRIRECQVLRALADHEQCLHEHH